MATSLLVTGATGTVGTHVVRELVGRGIAVRALVRSPEKAGRVRAAVATPIIGDFDDPVSLRAAVEGVERAFLLSAPDPRQVVLQTSFIDAAKAAGVGRIVKLSAVGAAHDSPVQLCRWHWEIEQRLEAAGMTWTHLRPHSFMQNLLMMARTIGGEGVLYAPAGNGRVPLVDARDIAAVAAAVLADPGHEGKAYLITGPEAVTYDEIAGHLGAAIGRPVQYADVPPDVVRQRMLAMGLPKWLADDLVTLYRLTAEGRAGPVTGVVRTVTGREPIRFEQFALDYADMFRGAARPSPPRPRQEPA